MFSHGTVTCRHVASGVLLPMSFRHTPPSSRSGDAPRRSGWLRRHPGLLLAATIVLALVSTVAATGGRPVADAAKVVGIDGATIDGLGAPDKRASRAERSEDV